MSSNIKWESISHGKASIVSVEFGDSEWSSVLNSEDADKLVSFLGTVSHHMTDLSNENNSLRNQVEKTLLTDKTEEVILSVINNLRSVLPGYSLVEDAENDDLGEPKEDTTVQTTLPNSYMLQFSSEPKTDIEFLNLIRAYKILGYSRGEIEGKIEPDLKHVLRRVDKDLRFGQLATDKDPFYKILFTDDVFYVRERVKDKHVVNRKYVYECGKFIRNEVKGLSLNDIAAELKMLPAYVWAYCVVNKLDFFMIDTYGNICNFEFISKGSSRKQRAYNKINGFGGIAALRKLKASGKTQFQVSVDWNVPSCYISSFCSENDEPWNKMSSKKTSS